MPPAGARVCALAWLASALVGSACNSDADPDDPLPPADSGTKVEIPDHPEFTYSDVPEPYPDGDVAACKAFDTTQTQRACLCDACFDLMRQCDALEGCGEILDCRLESGCTDSFSCYLLPGAPCTEVIDRWGNASAHAMLTRQIGDCATPAGCVQ